MASTSESEHEHEKITRLEEVSNDMLKMLKDGSSNDVKIILDDGELLANKDVLAARCEYFAATFRWNNKNNNESGKIRIEDCSKKVMQRIVEFLFTGVLKFKDLDMLSLTSLIDQIRKLVLGVDLQESVENYLLNFQADDSIIAVKEQDLTLLSPYLISTYQHAYDLNLEKIQNKLALFIAFIINCSENLLEEVNQKVVDLPMTLFRDILRCHPLICQIVNNLQSNPNLQHDIPTMSLRQMNKRIFQFFVAWYEKNKDGCSKADKDEMMQFIPLDKFLLSDLIKIVKPSGLFPDKEVDKMILAHAGKYDEILLGEEK